MVPKKSNVIIKMVAEENDISEKKVDLIVTSFYKEVRKNLSEITDLKVNLPGLGDFQLRFTMVKESTKNIEKLLEIIDPTESIQRYHQKKNLEKKYALLQSIQLKIDEYLRLKQKWKDDKAKGNLEK